MKFEFHSVLGEKVNYQKSETLKIKAPEDSHLPLGSAVHVLIDSLVTSL